MTIKLKEKKSMFTIIKFFHSAPILFQCLECHSLKHASLFFVKIMLCDVREMILSLPGHMISSPFCYLRRKK